MSNVENQVKLAMQASIDHLKVDLKALRTGRANSAILDKVTCEVYGSVSRLKEVASISVPEARQIVVTPFDTGTIHSVKKGIEAANLGVNPIVDGKVIRINIPSMDETARKNIVKQCKDLAEKSKIVMRDIRRKFNDLIRKEKAEGIIPEDMMKKQEKIIQDLTDRFCKEIDTLVAEKEKEVMTI